MGFRVRRSIKVVPGVRLNVSKTGVGVGVGPRGARYTVHSSGRRTTTVRSGIPGVYYQSQRGSQGKRNRTATTPVVRAASAAKPGMLASKGEKELFKAWSMQDGVAAEQAGIRHPAFELPAFTLAGFLVASSDGDHALTLFERAFALGDAADTEFFRKYVHVTLEIQIAEGVTAQLRPGRAAVGIALGELYQSDERLEEAINVVEQLEPTTYTAVSLAELYAQAGRYDAVIELTEGLTNEDDLTALLLVFRGVAFHEQNHFEAAHESLKEALRSRSRDQAIRNHALFERGRNYLSQGKKAMARKDFERILATDSNYPGLRDELAAIE